MTFYLFCASQFISLNLISAYVNTCVHLPSKRVHLHVQFLYSIQYYTNTDNVIKNLKNLVSVLGFFIFLFITGRVLIQVESHCLLH